MADAILDGDSVLEFVKKQYDGLKKQAQDDNNIPGPSNENITDVIARIDELYNTIKKGEVTHDEIVKQLNALKTQYNELSSQLGKDIASYTRYTEAKNSLNMIVDGFNEVDAGEGKGEELAPASESALVPASTALVSTASNATSKTNQIMIK